MKKNKGLNNKGYMLVEIILASAIAFGLAYFMIEITLKLKNKNDDLLVETLTYTDSAIISNEIMKYIKLREKNYESINCSDISNDITISNDNVGGKSLWHVKVDDKIVDEVNKYATIWPLECSLNGDRLHVKIKIRVDQLRDKNFDVDLYYIVH